VPDFTAIVLAVKQSGADVMGTYMFEADQAIFAKQLRQLGVRLSWVGSPTTASVTARNLAGPALYGTYAVTDFNENSSHTAESYATRYQTAYKVAPDFLSAWSYDALHVLARAMTEGKSLEPEKLRQSILAVKGYDGAEGVYNFDRNGDGLHGGARTDNAAAGRALPRNGDYQLSDHRHAGADQLDRLYARP
jgi:branched-chain amino acid transport system substrate-binding protein